LEAISVELLVITEQWTVIAKLLDSLSTAEFSDMFVFIGQNRIDMAKDKKNIIYLYIKSPFISVVVN